MTPRALAPATPPGRTTNGLAPAIDGRRRLWRPAAPQLGQVCCYVAERRRGRPLLLVHDLTMTSSAFEMRPLFESFRWRRPTFAIDLPGFGLSDRGDAPYSRGVLAEVLAELLRKLRGYHMAVDVIALGRGSEPAARAVCEAPALVRSLAIIEPDGLLPTRSGALASLIARVALAAGDVAARRLYALMVWRPVARGIIRRRFRGLVDESLVDYACATAHVPGAHRAPLAVLATAPADGAPGGLYQELTVPVLIVHDAPAGRRVPLDAFLRSRANRFAARVSPTRGLPQFERLADTTSALDGFWRSLSEAARDHAIR